MNKKWIWFLVLLLVVALAVANPLGSSHIVFNVLTWMHTAWDALSGHLSGG